MDAWTWSENNPLAEPSELSQASIHVWCCSLDDPPVSPERLVEKLSCGERDYAQRHVFERDQMRSVASRGLLRLLLGAYLKVRPQDVALATGPHGKPKLAGQHASSGLAFNVAHSDDIVVYALALGADIGVDVEKVRHMPDAADVAKRFFAPSEIETLLALPSDHVDEAFFVCWTRKEAYVKARGIGLALPLDEFEVKLDSSAGSDRLRIPGEPEQAALWTLFDLRPLPDFVGALAVTGRSRYLRRFKWIR